MNWIGKEGIRKLVILSGQAVMVTLAFLSAVYLRYECYNPPDCPISVNDLIAPLIVIKLVSFAVMHLTSGWWRYVSIHDLILLLKGNLAGSVFFAVYLGVAPGGPENLLPSLVIIDGLLCFLIMSGARVAVRLVREYSLNSNFDDEQRTERVLIVGSGAAGQMIAREIQQNPKMKWIVGGYVDQDINRLKQKFQGVPVVSTPDCMDEYLKANRTDLVILANPALDTNELRKIVSTCQQAGVKSKILPNVSQILNDDVSVQHIRDVKLEDLLGRVPVHLDVSNIRAYLAGKRVLVTGAAGSIGEEICRQVAEFGAASVLLFDNAETPLFQVERNLRGQHPETEFIAKLSDVRDYSQVDYIFKLFQPHVVFHAAAYKHVPMSEENPITTIENNVLGSRVLANAADRHGADHFVMISTDKAVNPTNIMGASKRVAEHYVQSLAGASQTKFVTVRFGNVLGSNGSVVPIFQEQIRGGGPVTVTDPKMTRFFMTIPEAVGLVLQAGSMGEGGEIFILDMGEQISIVKLAEELIRLSGMTPYKDIDIVFTGLRPGEKLHEELLHEHEGVRETSHEKICVAFTCWDDLVTLNRLLDNLSMNCRAMELANVVDIMESIMPEYQAKPRTSREITGKRSLPPRKLTACGAQPAEIA